MSRHENDNQNNQKKGNPVVSFLTTLLLIVAIGVFCYAAYMLYGYYKQYKAGTDEYGNLNDKYVNMNPDVNVEPASEGDPNAGKIPVLKSVEDLENPDTAAQKIDEAATYETLEDGEVKKLPALINPINFKELNAINEEVIGWLRIRALDKSYPIAQAKDNDFYLHRTFEKVDNFAGCIFLNCDNTRYFTDQNSIVYGHNMRNGSMFGTLKEFKSQEKYDECPYFWIFTPDFIYMYKIFSCSEVAKVGDPYRIRFTTDAFREFLDKMSSQSMVDNHGMELTTDDRIVTLSTCTGNEATRFIVQGKLVQIFISK